MAADVIGRCKCPVCSSTRASLRLSGKSLSYVVCNACNVQVFARSDVSDEKLRALLLERDGQETPPAAPAPAPVPTPQPKAPEPVAAPPSPAPAPSGGLGWGFFR